MRRKLPFIFLIWLSLFTATVRPAEKPEAVRVLILGTYHFDKPGRDLHNMKVDDVRTPEKQAELADVATRLARFKPNKIAVEAVSERDDLTTKKFDGFTPEMLTKNADERVQIAFRLAHNLGQKSVYGIDEQSDKIDYFPYDKVQAYAKAHGKSAMLDDLNAQVGATISQMEADEKTKSVREMLNAKIFAKLTQIAKPGDRIVVTFGAGHCYWLRHFVRNTLGFVLVEADDYLR